MAHKYFYILIRSKILKFSKNTKEGKQRQ
uniref:Uncharacterized protein n=1 Tax=Rhizophora mucronata TaxID=61149 RepID=A0A2P2N1X3_RHIMU